MVLPFVRAYKKGRRGGSESAALTTVPLSCRRKLLDPLEVGHERFRRDHGHAHLLIAQERSTLCPVVLATDQRGPGLCAVLLHDAERHQVRRLEHKGRKPESVHTFLADVTHANVTLDTHVEILGRLPVIASTPRTLIKEQIRPFGLAGLEDSSAGGRRKPVRPQKSDVHFVSFLEVVLDSDAVRRIDRLAHRIGAVACKDSPASDRVHPSKLLRAECTRQTLEEEHAGVLLQTRHPVVLRRLRLHQGDEVAIELVDACESSVWVRLLDTHQIVACGSAAIFVGQTPFAHGKNPVRIGLESLANCLRELRRIAVANPERFAHRCIGSRPIAERKEQRHE